MFSDESKIEDPFLYERIVNEGKIPNWQEWKIKYISPSHLNKFSSNKQAWIIDYIYGLREAEFIPAAHRGTVVESAIENFYLGMDKDSARIQMHKDFFDGVTRYQAEAGKVVPIDFYSKEYLAIDKYFENGIDIFDNIISGMDEEFHLGEIGEMVPCTRDERKIGYLIKDLNINITGEFDYKFRNGKGEEVTVDNKTSSRLPPAIKSTGKPMMKYSKGRDDHRIQVSIYATAQGHDKAYICYQSPAANGSCLACLDEKQIKKEYEKFKYRLANVANILYTCEDRADGDIEKAKSILASTYPIEPESFDHYMMKGKEDKLDSWKSVITAWQ